MPKFYCEWIEEPCQHEFRCVLKKARTASAVSNDKMAVPGRNFFFFGKMPARKRGFRTQIVKKIFSAPKNTKSLALIDEPHCRKKLRTDALGFCGEMQGFWGVPKLVEIEFVELVRNAKLFARENGPCAIMKIEAIF